MKVIAECSINWKDLDEAKELMRQCHEAGAWAIKFQLYNEACLEGNPYKDVLMEHMLSFEDAEELFYYGKDRHIDVFFTCMFLEAVDWCEKLGVKYYKIRYVDRFRADIINKCLMTNKLVLVSGLHLFCIPEYPAELIWYPMILSDGYIGYSDHTKGTTLMKHVKLNYEYIEKHMKLNDDCADAEWAITPNQLKEVLTCTT